ncbi:MAG: cytochrome P450 [Solirubrobacteraceae bacterium]
MPTTLEQAPEQLIVDFDVYDPSLTIPVDRMQAAIGELAQRGPVVFSEAHGGHWIVTHFDAVRQVLADPDTFSSYPNNIVDAGMGKFIPLELDGAEHAAYRNVLQPLFNPSQMKLIEDEIRTISNELIDRFIERGHCEFVSEFAHELPARVFLALMGWPLEDAPMFSEATQAALVGKPGGTEEESAAVRAEAAGKMFAYFGQVVAERRGKPLDENADVTTIVVNSPIALHGEERLLTDAELGRLLFLVLIAGMHTTKGSLTWGVKYLAENPEVRARVVADPSLVPAAVEEVLRIEAAVIPGRRATRDVELGGVQLRAGDQLLLAYCAANRDASHFPEPDEFRLDRDPNDHFAFSGGPHRCIGRHLARRELKIAFEEINRRMPDIELSAEQPPIFHPSQTRGALMMPITFTPGPKEG